MKWYHGYIGLTCIGAQMCMSHTWTIQPKAVTLPHANWRSDMHACDTGRCTLAHSLCSESSCTYMEYSMAAGTLSLSLTHAI